MKIDSNETVLKPLLLISNQSSRTELLRFPDGLLAFEHAVLTLQAAIPTAPTIYISLHDESQKAGIQFRLDDPAPLFSSSRDDHDGHITIPSLQIILNQSNQDIVPASGLLAVHYLDPEAKWLVLGSNYPLLPASALLQLILEDDVEDTVTCFVNEVGGVEPLIGIWGPEALGKLKDRRDSLKDVIKGVNGRLVKPLREGWIKGVETREEWEEVLKALELERDETGHEEL